MVSKLHTRVRLIAPRRWTFHFRRNTQAEVTHGRTIQERPEVVRRNAQGTVVEPAPDGTPGMARGAVIERHEWFGEYDSQGKALISEFSDQGMTALAHAAGLQIGVVEHRYSVENGETRYTVTATIGSELPVVGWLLNRYLSDRVFTEPMLAEWMRHQVEEVGVLPYFLPQLYRQRGEGNHFVLDSSEL